MAAPKGNDFAKGNDGGRPLIHTDVKVVDTLIAEYFTWIEGEFEMTPAQDPEGNEFMRKVWTREPEPPTVTGLSLHLNFANKSTLYDYAEKEVFSNSIKRALTRIEKYHEIRASYGDKCTGNIFVLKNFGWKDTQAIDHTSKGESLNSPVINVHQKE